MSDRVSFRWGIPLLDAGITQVPNYFFDVYVEAGIKRHEFLLILHLSRYRYEREGSVACPTMATLAKQMGYKTTRALQQVLASLEERRLLIRHYRDGKSTIYDFTGFSELMLQTKQLCDAPRCTMQPDAQESPNANSRETNLDAHEEEQVASIQEKQEEISNQSFIAGLHEDSRQLNAHQPPRISAEQRMADTRAASARWYGKQVSDAGGYRDPDHPFEKAIKRYGDDVPALRRFQTLMEMQFALAPDWSNKQQVKSWATGVHELWVACGGNDRIMNVAYKRLSDSGMTIASPRSLVKTARAIAAERATAYVAPSARAVREYT